MRPYDNAYPQTPEDSFNYFLSSAHIFVEWCFGEVDRRWGILWGPIEGNLHRKKFIIDACLRLHNYLVEDRLSNEETNELDEDEIEKLDEIQDEFEAENPFEQLSFVCWSDIETTTDNQTQHEEENKTKLKHEGKFIRDKIWDNLWSKGLRRPDSSYADIYIRNRNNCIISIVDDNDTVSLGVWYQKIFVFIIYWYITNSTGMYFLSWDSSSVI